MPQVTQGKGVCVCGGGAPSGVQTQIRVRVETGYEPQLE